MDTRLVNKLFCFAYHQTSAPWKMPKKLLSTPLGLFNGDFSLGWSKRLFLYTLYRSTDTKENGMMLKRMSQFKTIALENSNPNSRSVTHAKRLIKMADLIRVPVPVELVNPGCEVFVHAFTPQTTIDTWLKLRNMGQSIFNTTRLALGFSSGERVSWHSLCNSLDMGYINMTVDAFQYQRVDQQRLLLAVKDGITSLSIDGPMSNLFAVIQGMVFPEVTDLSAKDLVPRDARTERVFPRLMAMRYVLTDQGQAILDRGMHPQVSFWQRIPNSGIRKLGGGDPQCTHNAAEKPCYLKGFYSRNAKRRTSS